MKNGETDSSYYDYPTNLVKRPKKGFLWGLGTQAHKQDSTFFRKKKLPTIRELMRFCEVYQCKDLKVVDLRPLERTDLRSFALIVNCFSSRHLYHVAKNLVKELKAIECEDFANLPTISGRADESWVLVSVKEIDVHFFLPEMRDQVNLESRWFEETPQELIKDFHLYRTMKHKAPMYDTSEESD